MYIAEIWKDIGSMANFRGGVIKCTVNALFVKNHRLAFQFWLRLLSMKPGPLLWLVAKVMYRKISTKYGLQIPPQTSIGEGLYIGHGIGVVIHKKTIIGRNCNIMQFVTIGSNKNTPAVIGDNVWIGPGVCIVEDVKIGNNVKIGAGSVVIKDIPDGATAVGNPNRNIVRNE